MEAGTTRSGKTGFSQCFKVIPEYQDEWIVSYSLEICGMLALVIS